MRQGIAAVGVIALATFLGRAVGANPVTAAFVGLVLVLVLAVWQGFLAGAIASLLATACLNFYFFPPVHSFHLSEPENWISLACFLIATTVASRLVVRARERAAEAESGRREIAALYELCVDLFTSGTNPGGLHAAAARALEMIGAQGGGLVLFDEGHDEEAARASSLSTSAAIGVGRGPVGGGSEHVGGGRDVRAPIVVGERTIGVLIVRSTRANPEAIASVARLLALALERERFLAEQARLEALQASDSLRTALLRAVSHDLSTPLTAILLALETLKRETAGEANGSRTVALIAEETSRLNRRVQNLLAMARLEAENVSPRREPTPPADLFHAARENLRSIASTRGLLARVASECPDLDVDPSLALEILVNLIENADRASPPGAPIELHAAPHPSRPGRVRIDVLDRGSGLSPGSWRVGMGSGGGAGVTGGEGAGSTGASSEQGHGAHAAGDVGRRGLGLEIARTFAEAHDGSVALVAREGGGVAARIELPAAGSRDVRTLEAR